MSALGVKLQFWIGRERAILLGNYCYANPDFLWIGLGGPDGISARPPQFYWREHALGVMARSYTWSVFADAVEKEFDGDTETRAYISWSMATVRERFRDAFASALAGIVSPGALGVIVRKTKEAAEKTARGMAFSLLLLALMD